MASELSGTMPADVPDGAVSVPDGAAEQRPDTSGVLQQVGLSPEQDQHRPSSGGPRQSDAQLPPADPPSPQRPHSPNPDPTPALQQQCPSPSTPPQKQQQQLQPDPTPGPIQVIADVHGTGPDAFAAPSDFMMYVFKVLPCPHGNSHAWAQCPFLHPGEHARRRDPRVYPYSPVACPDMKRVSTLNPPQHHALCCEAVPVLLRCGVCMVSLLFTPQAMVSCFLTSLHTFQLHAAPQLVLHMVPHVARPCLALAPRCWGPLMGPETPQSGRGPGGGQSARLHG
jgi:hypothetical protein